MLNPVDISGSDHQNDISVAQPILSSGPEEVKGIDESGGGTVEGDSFRKSLRDRGLGRGVFSRSEDGGDQDIVGIGKTVGELLQKVFRTVGLVGLEEDSDTGERVLIAG